MIPIVLWFVPIVIRTLGNVSLVVTVTTIVVPLKYAKRTSANSKAVEAKILAAI